MSSGHEDPDEDATLALALQLQEQFDLEAEQNAPNPFSRHRARQSPRNPRNRTAVPKRNPNKRSSSSSHSYLNPHSFQPQTIIIGGDSQVPSKYGPPRNLRTRYYQDYASSIQPDVDHMTHEQLLELCERIGDAPNAQKGLSSEQFSLLPQYTFHSVDTSTPSADSDRLKCLICLEDYAEGDTLTALPCIHSFHTHCIREWLSQSRLCPICKETL